MLDFEVIVKRIHDGSGFGIFISKVYAINGNEMLVYDDGWDDGQEGKIIPHFEWVDFTREEIFCGERERIVQLKEQNNES